MNTRTMNILGIVFLIVGLAGLVGCIFLWFYNYWAMENDYYHYGDSIMIAFTIVGLVSMILLYSAIPLLIISRVRKNRESLGNVAENNTVKAVKYCICCGEKHDLKANFCTRCGRTFN